MEDLPQTNSLFDCRGSKGGGSIDMESQVSTPLLSATPELSCHSISSHSNSAPTESLEPELSLASPVPRRLVVMFDGTSNMRNSLTNVSRFFEAIDDSRPDEYKVVHTDERALHHIHLNKGGPGFGAKVCATCGLSPKADAKLHKEKPPSCNKGPDGKCKTCEQPLKHIQLVHYVRGVGSKRGDGVGCQAFGKGLSTNIKDGYKWLVANYRDGDEIFVFGFSRGAFSARSLVSLLHRCGGLPVPKDPQKEVSGEEYTTDDIVHDAYAMYQAFDPKDTLKPEFLKRGKVLYDGLHKSGKGMQRVTVAMLGVWDTVGAVGIGSIPFLPSFVSRLYYHMSSKHYEFHDQDLPCIVENAYHALAIDEHRFHFAPTLWKMPRMGSESEVDEMPSTSDLASVTNPKCQMPSTSDSQSDKKPKKPKKIPLKEVKQVWFVGSHCNVGGGADLDDLIDPDDLWLYSYVWMQKHAEKLGLRFYWTYETPQKKTKTSSPKRYISHRNPEPSYKNFLSGFYQYYRLPYDRDVTASITTGAAKLHWSVVERIKVDWVKLPNEQTRSKDEQEEQIKKKPYRPESLFKESPAPTIWSFRRWIWWKWTLLLCTLGISKPAEDHGKLGFDKHGNITLSEKWKWPWIEYDDLQSVEQLREASQPTLSVAKQNPCTCNCELKVEPQGFKDERWPLRKLWDWWINWRPL